MRGPNGRRVETTCQYCGKVTTRVPSMAGRKFCSRDCSNRFNWEYGNRAGDRKRKRPNKGKSNAEHVANRIPVSCLYCGTVMMRPPSLIRKKVFCTKECSNLAQKNGYVRYVKKCPTGCTCKRHVNGHGRKKDKITSSPCRNCDAVRLVSPCHGPGQNAEKKFCNRNCWDEYQQRQKATRRITTGRINKSDMSPEEYQERLTAQGGVCGICGQPRLDHNGKLHKDHCHTTGEWRGLLCGHCNKGLGLFNDDPELLVAAAFYLMKEVNILDLPSI